MSVENPHHDLESGSTFVQRYRIVEKIGEDGMGSVYKGEDTISGSKVALKLLRPGEQARLR